MAVKVVLKNEAKTRYQKSREISVFCHTPKSNYTEQNKLSSYQLKKQEEKKLPFPADFSIDREHARTGLSCPGDRPWGGVHARTRRFNVQIYAYFSANPYS